MALLPLVGVLALPSSSAAESPLPFTAQFAERVEVTFFDGDLASPEKIAPYREVLEIRRREQLEIFTGEKLYQGADRDEAAASAARKKEVSLFDMLLGSGGDPGWLGMLADETDPVAARRLAGRILEIDHALGLEGDKPKSMLMPENLAAISNAGPISVLGWSIPKKTSPRGAKHEATNLLNPESGLYYESDEIRQLVKQGVDISQLGPGQSSTFWRDPGVIAERDVVESYLGGEHPGFEGLEIPFPQGRARFGGLALSQTKPKIRLFLDKGGKTYVYKLKIGGEIYSAPTAGALMTAMGYGADPIIHVEKFRIDMAGASLVALRSKWRAYYQARRTHLAYDFDDYMDVGEDEDGTYLILKEGSITAQPREVIRVGPWPFGGNGNEGLREARGLAVFDMWIANTDMKESDNNKLLLRRSPDGSGEIFHTQHDLGHAFGRILSEQVNAYPWNFVRSPKLRSVRFNYHATWSNSVRKRITHADARWMVRQIAQLRREQIRAAVELGGWPEPAAIVLVEKLIHRRNQLVEAFGLEGGETPSGPIAMLPVDREITSEDGVIEKGELTVGEFEGGTQDLTNYWEELFAPVWDQAKLISTVLFQGVIGSVDGIVFDEDSVGISKYVVIELLVNVSRKVEPNPRPAKANDFFLTTDVLRLGLRFDGGLVGQAGFTVWREFRLLRPYGTKREAIWAGDEILNVFMPWRVWRANLPEEYVLVRDTYFDLHVGATSSDSAGIVAIVGVKGRLGRARLSRSVIGVKGDELRALREGRKLTRTEAEVFLNLVFIRLPFGQDNRAWGNLEAKVYTVDLADAEKTPEFEDAMTRLITRNDFSALETHVPGAPLSSKFRTESGWFKLPALFGVERETRFDEVRVYSPTDEEKVVESLLQGTRSGAGHWVFLDWGERHRHSVRSVAAYDPVAGELEIPPIVSTYYKRDRKTWDDELAGPYLGFVNGISGRDEPLIHFTPELHSLNRRWGDLEVKVRVGYSPEAVARMLELRHDEFWARMAVELEMEPAELDSVRWRMARHNFAKPHQRRRIPMSMRAKVNGASRLLDRMEAVRDEPDPRKSLRALVNTLYKASPYLNGWFDPTLLGVLHRVIGPEFITIDAMILPPPWIENRLVGEVPLQAHTHAESQALYHVPVDFDPGCNIALWEMLDTFPEADGEGVRWRMKASAGSGMPCDASQGAFASSGDDQQ